MRDRPEGPAAVGFDRMLRDEFRVERRRSAMPVDSPARRLRDRLSAAARFIVLDLNHYRKEGVLHASGAQLLRDGTSPNWTDPGNSSMARQLR